MYIHTYYIYVYIYIYYIEGERERDYVLCYGLTQVWTMSAPYRAWHNGTETQC